MTRNYSSTAVATTLSAGCTSASTTVSVNSTAGFPAAPFILALDAGAAAQELVLVTGVSGLNLTVTRGYDSTSAQAHSTGAVVQHAHGGIDFREARQHEAATSGVHGTSGSLVGTAGAQTLTNKTLTSPTITKAGFPTGAIFYSATDPGADAAGGDLWYNTSGSVFLRVGSAWVELANTSEAQTLTNKTLALDANTVTKGGVVTRAVFYSATDPGAAAGPGDLWYNTSGKMFYLVGSTWFELVNAEATQTLTSKTLALGSNTVTGTKAQFDAACTDGDFVYQSAVDAAWTPYTPTLTNFSGTVAYARYQKIGKTVRAQVKINVTSNVGTTITVSLPMAPRTGHPDSTWDAPIGTAICADGTSARLQGAVLCIGPDVQFASPDRVSAGNELGLWHVNSSWPISWGSGDTIAFNCEYETA